MLEQADKVVATTINKAIRRTVLDTIRPRLNSNTVNSLKKESLKLMRKLG